MSTPSHWPPPDHRAWQTRLILVVHDVLAPFPISMAAEPNLALENRADTPLPSAIDARDTSLEPEEDPESLPDDTHHVPDQPPPKRKGGRKPVRLRQFK